MDDKIKEVLRQAVLVVEYREGDIDTADGSVATTEIDSMLRLEAALCEAFNTESDNAMLWEIGPKITELKGE